MVVSLSDILGILASLVTIVAGIAVLVRFIFSKPPIPYKGAIIFTTSIITLLLVIVAFFAVRTITNSWGINGFVSQQNATPTATPPPALVPVGPLLYTTSAPGTCDKSATWAQNGQAIQSCQPDALIMSATECDCPIGIATLSSLPGQVLPDNYVAQISAENVGSASDAKSGFKFRQQSIQDNGNGHGGYSFLVDPNGQWQFNLYSSDGGRQVLVQQQLPSTVQGNHTLDLVVKDSTYSFYFDGKLVTTQTDSTYASGFFCLAIEPGATVYFRTLAIFAAP